MNGLHETVMDSRDGAVARKCGSGSTPGLGVIRGLSLMLVLVLISIGRCRQLVLCANYIDINKVT